MSATRLLERWSDETKVEMFAHKARCHVKHRISAQTAHTNCQVRRWMGDDLAGFSATVPGHLETHSELVCIPKYLVSNVTLLKVTRSCLTKVLF